MYYQLINNKSFQIQFEKLNQNFLFSLPFLNQILFMNSNYKPIQQHLFNDYTIVQQAPTNKLLSSHERCLSSGSIQYQNNFNRKKLTVTSRENGKEDFRGDYLMPKNSNSLFSTTRTKNQNSLRTHNLATQSLSNQNSRHLTQNLTQSRIHRNKLKRPTSPSPMTPSKILRLKKSMIQQGNHSNKKLIHTEERSKHKYQSYNVSPMRNPLESHRQLFSYNQVQNSQSRNQIQNIKIIQTLKGQLLGIFNNKIFEFQNKISFQEETIKKLQKRLIENQSRIKQKQTIISNFNKKNTKLQQQAPTDRFNYILKRIKDLQVKVLFIKQVQNVSIECQYSMDKKLQFYNSFLNSFVASKLQAIKNTLNGFIEQKENSISKLYENFYYVDNKLIGRTQMIKQTLAEIKQKVKEVQDSWTHKETKDTTSRDKSYDDVSQVNIINNKNIKHFSNRLRQLTSNNYHTQNIFQNAKGKDSLDYSLTSYEDPTLNNKFIDKNNRFQQKMNQIQESQINIAKDDLSRLTDDFYYPNSSDAFSRVTSEKVTPVNKKHTNQYFGPNQKSQQKYFKKKQSPLAQSPIQNLNKVKQEELFSQERLSPLQNNRQKSIKISHQAINRKIQSIKQLIAEKRSSNSSDIEKKQLRCFVDKSGYLKYIDSKTFVFDNKGNLINCTQGQYWFLVTKGLIYGKGDDDQSRTMSFVEYKD